MKSLTNKWHLVAILIHPAYINIYIVYINTLWVFYLFIIYCSQNKWQTFVFDMHVPKSAIERVHSIPHRTQSTIYIYIFGYLLPFYYALLDCNEFMKCISKHEQHLNQLVFALSSVLSLHILSTKYAWGYFNRSEKRVWMFGFPSDTARRRKQLAQNNKSNLTMI